MNVFLDTEFTELTQQAQLLSIGLAAENGDWFYAELTEVDPGQATPWVQQQVIPLLSGEALPMAMASSVQSHWACRGNPAQVQAALRAWIKRLGTGENSLRLWADVLAWDWVLFCELFGGAFGIPSEIFFIPVDLSTLLWAHGFDPNATREELGSVDLVVPTLHLAKHHALYDAWLEKTIVAQHAWGHPPFRAAPTG